MSVFEKLGEIREKTGKALCEGLSDSVIKKFIQLDPSLSAAIEEASATFGCLNSAAGNDFDSTEDAYRHQLQKDYVNFYGKDAVNPYIALSAKGPWIVTLYGAVIHDSGGYGMLGFGHGPDDVIFAMSRNHVMANIMTPNFSHKRLAEALNKEIGHSRKNRDGVYSKYICMNSGSESVTVASRITDLNAAKMTAEGGKHQGKKIMFLAVKGAFHGRTDRPAQYSDSSMKSYMKLASFRDRGDKLYTVESNNVDQLHQIFDQAKKDNCFIEAMFMEPVMGEGNPGQAVSVEFYNAARKLTKENGSMLVVDSIQAGLRTHGVLSILDYPGFQEVECPDMETYSKALNAGQYPLSVLALNDRSANLYERGLYGNTMTTNPRALEVACTVMSKVTPELRKNISQKGHEFKEKFIQMQKRFPKDITRVEGTGLLFAVHLDPKRIKVVGIGAIEEYLRIKGLGVIHGGENALRFTPHFAITSEEVDLVVETVEESLSNGPRLS